MAGWMLSTMPRRPPPSCGRPIRTTVRESRVAGFARWVREHRDVGSDFPVDDLDYAGLHAWSVRDLDGFWSALAEHLGVIFHDPPTATLGRREMPGTEWFPGSTLNYAEHALTPGPGRGDDDIAAVAVVEDGTEREVTHAELRDLVARARAGLAAAGVGRGDRVVALVPNSVETLVAFLATASLGAVWSSCSPDFGTRAVLDRFAQIEPTVFVAVDGYRYNGKRFDVRETVGALQKALPTLRATVLVPHLDPEADARRHGAVGDAHRHRRAAGVHARPVRPPAVGALLLRDDRAAQGHRAVARRDRRRAPQGARVPARPRPRRPVPVVHHHRLDDVELPGRRPAGRRDGRALRRQPGPPRHGCAVGRRRASPGGPVRHVGALPAGVPEGGADARRAPTTCRPCRRSGSTGSPLSPEQFTWIAAAVGEHVQICSVSGGTDVCTAFLASAPTVPVWLGELSCAALGADVHAVDEKGMRRPAQRRSGRRGRAGDQPADAVDAGGVLGRPRRQPAARGLLRRLPGSLAARRLGARHAARLVRDQRAQRLHAQPRRRPDGHRRPVRRDRGLRRGGRLAGGRHHRARLGRGGRAAVLPRARGRRVARGRRARHPVPRCARSCRRGTSRTGSCWSTRCRGR